jgi:hypothetical protein
MRTLPAIAFAFLLCARAQSCQPFPAPSENIQSKQGQTAVTEKDSQQDQRGTKGSPLAIEGQISATVIGKVTAAKNAADADEDRRARESEAADKRIELGLLGFGSFLTLALTIITGLLAYYTAGLWKSTSGMAADAKETSAIQDANTKASLEITRVAAVAAERNARAAEDTLVTANRPWLKTALTFPKPAINEGDGWRLFIDVNATCYGGAPALAAHAWAMEMPDEFDGVNIAPIADKNVEIWAKNEGGGEVVMPMESMTMPQSFGIKTWSIHFKKPATNGTFHVLAGVAYRFSFGPVIPRYTLSYLMISDNRNPEDLAKNPNTIPVENFNVFVLRTYVT